MAGYLTTPFTRTGQRGAEAGLVVRVISSVAAAALYHAPINLSIHSRHPSRIPKPLGPQAGGLAKANLALEIFEHSTDASSKFLCVEELG